MNCKKVKARPFKYNYDTRLPNCRTVPSAPFDHVGLDYLGPIQYKTDDDKLGKAYALIYTCLKTRATILELIPDATTANYLLALRAISSACGVPPHIYCDNAPTFTLGHQMVNQDIRLYAPSNSMICFLAKYEIQVHNITPFAPWQGGVYERIVGIAKHQLRKTIGKKKLTFFELSSTLRQVQGMINNRPLTPDNTDPNDLTALRPIDFLLPKVQLDAPNEVDLDEPMEYSPKTARSTEQITRRHLARVETTVAKLWQIWSTSYLLFLRERQKTNTRDAPRDPKQGDIVLVGQEMLPRHTWPLGKIVELIPSKEGNIESARVRFNNSTLERSLNQLYPLEVTAEDIDNKDKIPQKDEETDSDFPEPSLPMLPSLKFIKSRKEALSSDEARFRKEAPSSPNTRSSKEAERSRKEARSSDDLPLRQSLPRKAKEGFKP